MRAARILGRFSAQSPMIQASHAAFLVAGVVLSAGAVVLLMSVENGLAFVDRFYTRSPLGRPGLRR